MASDRARRTKPSAVTYLSRVIPRSLLFVLLGAQAETSMGDCPLFGANSTCGTAVVKARPSLSVSLSLVCPLELYIFCLA